MPESWAWDLINNFSWEHVRDLKPQILSCLEHCEFRRHPLGFVHIVLMDSPNVALRFHIWIPGIRSVQEPAWLIHTHTFDLRSIVLFGKLENSLYKWEEDISPSENRLYEVTYSDGISCIVATDRIGKIQDLSSLEVSKGRGYTVAYGDFHRTEVLEDQLTATIALATKHSGNPLVVGTIDGAASYSYLRRELTDETRRAILKALATALDE
jgi:hypothetical protein